MYINLYTIIVPTTSKSRIPLNLVTTELWYLNQMLPVHSLYASWWWKILIGAYGCTSNINIAPKYYFQLVFPWLWRHPRIVTLKSPDQWTGKTFQSGSLMKIKFCSMCLCRAVMKTRFTPALGMRHQTSLYFCVDRNHILNDGSYMWYWWHSPASFTSPTDKTENNPGLTQEFSWLRFSSIENYLTFFKKRKQSQSKEIYCQTLNHCNGQLWLQKYYDESLHKNSFSFQQ